jgi:Flp pilus assembly pilin Flp
MTARQSLNRPARPERSFFAMRFTLSDTSPPGTIEHVNLRSDAGQTTVEYAVVLTFVIALAVAAFAAFQPGILAFFTDILGQLSSLSAGA